MRFNALGFNMVEDLKKAAKLREELNNLLEDPDWTDEKEEKRVKLIFKIRYYEDDGK